MVHHASHMTLGKEETLERKQCFNSRHRGNPAFSVTCRATLLYFVRSYFLSPVLFILELNSELCTSRFSYAACAGRFNVVSFVSHRFLTVVEQNYTNEKRSQ